jgi:hypothetical protein
VLKNNRSHRNTVPMPTYTVIVDHPLDAEHPTPAEIAEARQMHVGNVHHAVTSLGHRPEGLLAALKPGVISARFLVHVENDEAAAQLHALISNALCQHTTTRMVLGESIRERHDHPLVQAA